MVGARRLSLGLGLVWLLACAFPLAAGPASAQQGEGYSAPKQRHGGAWPMRQRLRAAPGPLETGPEELVTEEGAPPLPARELRRLGIRPKARALPDLSRWPAEPESPAPLDAARLAAALAQLCPPGTASTQLDRIAAQITLAAREFSVDALLLGALVYHQSSCRIGLHNNWGVGLTMLNRGLMPAGLVRGVLAYRVPGLGGQSVVRPFAPPRPLAQGALLDPATNLYTAAALLRMWKDQCRAVDAMFQSEPHRHHVSHFIWGDKVRGAGPEDGVLTARRRLIQYYAGAPQASAVRLKELSFGSPLDGAPRIVTSGLGEPREQGRRAHAGVDFFARWGEPVRAVADGEISRAGCDLSDGTLLDLTSERAALVRERDMGVRGLFVEVIHPNGYRSVYAHLASYTVLKGAKVRLGEVLGYVGLTGVRESDPHLHFGLFDGTAVVDPRQVFTPYLFAPQLEQREATIGEERHADDRPRATSSGLR